MTSFTVIGDVMIDVLARIDQPIAYGSDTPAHITRSVGGSAANTAAWLAALGQQVRLVAATGDDAARRDIEVSFDARGVEPHLERVPSAATGTCIVVIDESGERTMLPDTGANAHLSSPWCLDHLGEGHLHASAYPLFQSTTAETLVCALREARSRGLSTSLDLASSAPVALHRDAVREACAVVDIVFSNEAEARALLDSDESMTNEQLECALRGLASLVVLKLGRDGALALTPDSVSRVRAVPVDVVDTTGAGDALAAGFLAAWIRTGDLTTALGEGVRTAARVIERVGAGPPPLVAGD